MKKRDEFHGAPEDVIKRRWLDRKIVSNLHPLVSISCALSATIRKPPDEVAEGSEMNSKREATFECVRLLLSEVGLNNLLYALNVRCWLQGKPLFEFIAIKDVIFVVLIQHLNGFSHRRNK